ncbi:MAG: TetR/AcrR family transcriptional regulator [Chryseolinea sp.]
MTPIARKESIENQKVTRRAPRQARSLHKVELMLEAAMQLIDKGSIETLTTNAVAQQAGVSIGTLYQYFGDKQALLDALVQRHLDTLATRVQASLDEVGPREAGGRIRVLVRSVMASYGGRRRVHRQLMTHALSGRRPGAGLMPFYAQLVQQLARDGVRGPDGKVAPVTEAQAFVMTHAIAGVLRALAASESHPPPAQEVEDALVRLVLGFVGPRSLP